MLLDTPICNFNWQASDFTLKDVHGNPHKLSDYLGNHALLIAFVCNHCPYVQTIGERLARDCDELMQHGINVLAVMSNDYNSVAADSPANMKLFAQKYGWNFPYLVDETQSVGKAYGAVCTPDFFGFNKAGGLQYRGRLDDAGMKDASKRQRELFNAMIQIEHTDKGPTVQTPSMGCSIKWR